MSVPALRERACPACGSKDARPEVASRRRADFRTVAELRPFWLGIDKEKRFFTYHRCQGCGLLYNRIFFDHGQLSELYSAMPPNMDLVPTDAIAATQRGYLRAAVARGRLEGDYLEIGPDVGFIVGEAVRRGNFGHFWLFEPNIAVHGALKTAISGNKGDLLTDMANLSAVPDGSVGLAVMVHVLDHLLDPLAMLTNIRAKLRPGGLLMIVTHDERSALSRLLGPRWPAFCLQHPELYNPATIRYLLDRAGFTAIEVTRSTNHFPIDFLARQAAWTLGLRLPKTRLLPSRAIELRLGNILTLATASDQAASAPVSARFESVA